jgi:hypothetical protein
MTKSETSNSNSPPRPLTITVQKSHHAVTSIVGNSTRNYLKITEHLANVFLEHQKHCDSAARELAAALKELGVEKRC